MSMKFSICVNNYVFLKHDNLVLKALKICFGNQAGALSLMSPFHVALFSLPLSQKLNFM